MSLPRFLDKMCACVCVCVRCNWWMMAKNSLFVLFIVERMHARRCKVQRTVPSSRGYVIMRVPKRVDFVVCPHCDTSVSLLHSFFFFFFFFPCSPPPFFCSKTIYIKQKQKCLSTLANVRINIFSSPFQTLSILAA